MRRRVLLVLLVVAATVGLTGCDPYPNSGVEGGASIDVILDAEGGAQAQLYLDPHERTHAELSALGERVAALLFPTALRHTVAVDDNTAGYPFVRIEADRVYEPGPHPVVSLDARPAVAALLGGGFRSVHFSVGAPRVPSTASWAPTTEADDFGYWSWDSVVSGDAAPVGSIVFSPEPRRGLPSLALWLGSLGLLGFALIERRRRRRALVVGTAIAAAVGAFVTLATAVDARPENLGVAGYLSGGWLAAATMGPVLSSLLIILAAVSVLIAALASPFAQPARAFNPPPGWPSPPPGWVPAPGWAPDPTWPAAPHGWVFYAEPAAGRDRKTRRGTH